MPCVVAIWSSCLGLPVWTVTERSTGGSRPLSMAWNSTCLIPLSAGLLKASYQSCFLLPFTFNIEFHIDIIDAIFMKGDEVEVEMVANCCGVVKCMYMYLCVCMCIYIYIYIYIYICIYTHTYIHIYIYIYVYIYICTRVCVSVYIYIYTVYIYICIDTFVCVYVCVCVCDIQVHTHTHTYIYIYIYTHYI